MADYSFYMTRYGGGSIPECEWPRLGSRANEQLARYKRVYTVSAPDGCTDAEDMAVCAMAEAMYGFELIANGEGGAVQSASIGSVSVNYGRVSGVDMSPAGQARELYRCACRYLDICRGVC